MSIAWSKQYSTSLKVGMIVVVRMSGRLVVTWLPVPIEPWAAVAPRNVAPSATRPTAIRVTERARLGKLDILEVSSFWDHGPIELQTWTGFAWHTTRAAGMQYLQQGISRGRPKIRRQRHGEPPPDTRDRRRRIRRRPPRRPPTGRGPRRAGGRPQAARALAPASRGSRQFHWRPLAA